MKLSKKATGVLPSATLEITAKAKRLKKEGKKIIAFTAGEPDFNTPDFIVNSAITALKEGFTKYTPSAGIPELRAAIAEKFRNENGIECDAENIVVSDGAKSSLYHAMLAVIDDGDEVIVPSPYWVTYTEQIKLCGGVPVLVPTKKEDGYKMTAADFENTITGKTRALLINSPCNPTGAVYEKRELTALAEICEKHGLEIISDEIYENLVFGGKKHYSFAALSDYAREHTITVNGVSKSYSMTGWRIGYVCAPIETAKAMSALQGHTTSNACTFAQYASVTAIKEGGGFINEMRCEFDRRREVLIEALKSVHGITFAVPDGAFYVFADVSALYGKKFKGEVIDGSQKFAAKLLDFGVAVIPGAAFGDDNSIRLSYTLPADEIVKGIAEIKRFVKELL